jgi:hypothetical protein
MVKVRSLSSFEHYGPRPRGTEFEVNPQHAEVLVKRGLVGLVGAAAGDAPVNTGSVAVPVDGALLVRQKAVDAIAAVASVKDVAVLQQALAAEMAKVDKVRGTVIEAIEAAIKGAEATKE